MYVLILTAWTLIVWLLLLGYLATVWSTLISICCGDPFIELDVVQLDLPDILVLKVRLVGLSGGFASLIILGLILDLYDGFVQLATLLVLLFNYSARTVLDIHDVILRLVSQLVLLSR